MKNYLVTFTPTQPYFFGNEKSFKYPGSTVGQQSNRYFIKSELMPSQSTIIGVLRYCLLAVKKSDFKSYTDDDRKLNAAAVGGVPFNIESTTKQTFGKIEKVYPVFITDGKEELVVTPMDHRKSRIEGDKKIKNTHYSPFDNYVDCEIPDGKYKYLPDFDAKDGVEHSFMKLSTGELVKPSSIFESVTRVGINRTNSTQGFFKKQYNQLINGYSFACYVELADDAEPKDTVCCLGQGKSVFIVHFEEKQNDIAMKISKHLREEIVYCFSDCFVSSNIYKNLQFAVTDTKDFRTFRNDNGKITKDSALYKLITAGSIFIPNDTDAFVEKFNNINAKQIGFNKIIVKGEEK